MYIYRKPSIRRLNGKVLVTILENPYYENTELGKLFSHFLLLNILLIYNQS